ncbi:LPXTG-motif cell wall-anchored protein [Allocatelliglobosispora scoriae]|uniref:LPXTG-motif cell wall-anchored protein n=1 Tax=Allocatelliglobosispora scoriae TaxID=643052 RepID=A0A841BZZ9_9ACTN|nr:LPXTG cell wall anchor domain-containing protein [Allocatelliglobosispora scoriae]MBB5873704.1 LPXTG-motif cell wall-anchored protein [Allocatelliglobosispora scoriae]
MADPGCTGAEQQLANTGGKFDSMITMVGILLFIATAFVLAAAFRRAPGWRSWTWGARGVGIGFALLLVGLIAAEDAGLGGLLERLLAASGAAAIAVFALRIARHRPEPG